MSISDLDLILKKDPIISTWPARSLSEEPEAVERDYLIHARTHLSLGDTASYVQTIFRWVGGVNKGTFVGGVLGDYGEGKTSFLVHVWSESRKENILTVPPFEWSAFEQIVEATTGWVRYVMGESHPGLYFRVRQLHEGFQRQTAEGLAKDVAQSTGRDFDTALAIVEAGLETGQVQFTGMSAARLLDFLAAVTQVAAEAGYGGLLVLLDEPEVAAKRLGGEAVQHFLFDLANELHLRQGSYGIFLSMPDNFFASAQRRFSALPARLQARNCFPRLGDLYGADFAEVLWNRYCEEFDLGQVGRELVSPMALKAIGQIGSSARKDLAYGPRSVISVFRRMVDHFTRTDTCYRPEELVHDILDDELMLRPDYRSRLLSVFRSPDVNDANRDAVTLLSAFPSGLPTVTLQELGHEKVLRPLARAQGLVYRTAYTMGLRSLREPGMGAAEEDPVVDMIEEIDGEFAPDRRTFEQALEALVRDIVPIIFREREGLQLDGWQPLKPLVQEAQDVYFGASVGAFRETSRQFPSRAVILLVTGEGASLQGIPRPPEVESVGLFQYDLLYHFCLRWHDDQKDTSQVVELVEDPAGTKPSLIRTRFDLREGLVAQAYLADIVGAQRLSPFWVLNFLNRMRGVKLDRENEAAWQTLRDQLQTRLMNLLLGPTWSEALRQSFQVEFEERVSGSGLSLLGGASNALLERRCPDYSTLIRQPRWQSRVDVYINALMSSDVPLACKRGREPWTADDDVVTRVLGSSRMNLTGGAFHGYEDLIEIESERRSKPLKVTFHVHPLESEIRDSICTEQVSRRILKREGKECPFIPIDEILDIVRDKGYTIEELHKIIEIGEARGSYTQGTYRRERVLYCVPLAVPELKIQLGEKLDDLVAEIKTFNALPGYHSSFDPEEMAKNIAKIADDADYQRLVARMNKEFESNHQRLPTYFDRAQEDLRENRRRAKAVQDQLSQSRVRSLLDTPTATSKWCEPLVRFVGQNLRQTLAELKDQSTKLLGQADECLESSVFARQRHPAENIELLRRAWSAKNDLADLIDRLHQAARQFIERLAGYGAWRQLLRESDQVYGRLLELEQHPNHETKAAELLRLFDLLSAEISDYVTVRNVSGLPSYRQFEEKLAELEKARQDYMKNLKVRFDRQREQVNGLLAALHLDARVREVFNPTDLSGCYDRLFSEGARLITVHALRRVSQEVEDQIRDLTYNRDVLRSIEPEAAGALLVALSEGQGAVERLEKQIDPDWLRTVADKGDSEGQSGLAETIDGAFETIRQARRKVHESTQTQPPEEGRAKEVFDLIPETDSVDLKDLVLQMMTSSGNSSQALETSLTSLIELFRRNCIQVMLQRRTR